MLCYVDEIISKYQRVCQPFNVIRLSEQHRIADENSAEDRYVRALSES